MDNLIKAFKVIKGFDEVFGEVISCIGGGKFITRARPLKNEFGMYLDSGNQESFLPQSC